MTRKTRLVRLSPESHAQLLRLADRTGLMHPEIITRALDTLERQAAAEELPVGEPAP